MGSFELGVNSPLNGLLKNFLDDPLETAARVTGFVGVVVVADRTTPKNRMSHGAINPQRLSYHITREREWGCVGIINIMYLIRQHPGVPQELNAVVAPVVDRDASAEMLAHDGLAPRVVLDVLRDLEEHAVLVDGLRVRSVVAMGGQLLCEALTEEPCTLSEWATLVPTMPHKT